MLFVSNTRDPATPIYKLVSKFDCMDSNKKQWAEMVPPIQRCAAFNYRRQGCKLPYIAPLYFRTTNTNLEYTSVVANNTCVLDKINTYFQTGELPGNENFRSLEAGAWDVTTPQGIERECEWLEGDSRCSRGS
jgi:hypothetical protein